MSGPPVSPHRRRAARYLLAGIALFALALLGVLLARPRSAPYVPGREVERGAEITQSLKRGLPEARREQERGAPADEPGGAEGGAGGGTPAGDVPGGSRASRRPAGPVFSDRAGEAGLRFVHFAGRRSSQLPEDMGSGLAWGDYDDDGAPDLFVVNESGPLTLAPDEHARSPAHARLYRNRGDGRFEDATEAAGLALTGLGMGAAWGDYDGDGDLDLFVTRYGTTRLFRNEGGGRFRDVSDATGVGAAEGFWTGVSLADYDRDGDLDAYVCGYVRYAYDPAKAGASSQQFKAVVPYTLNPSSYPPERNLLLRNDGGAFVEVAREAGVDNPTGRSLSAAWSDFDDDGWPDLYVANDVSDNAMYRNLGNGRFADVSHSAWVADYRGAMGLGVGDWENDGDLDIFVTHWLAQENALYADESRSMKTTPESPLRFVDQADLFGLGQIALDAIGWGTGFLDFDGDGWLDLYTVNGSTFQQESDPAKLVPMRSFLFWNSVGDGYYELGEQAGEPFATPAVARGSAIADYDGDGAPDVAIVVHGGALRLARNELASRNGWARVVLRAGRGARHTGRDGAVRLSTRFATGAHVRLTAAGHTQRRVVGGQPSYLSQEPPGEVLFGTGAASRIDSLEIRWPSGRVQSFADLPVRTTIRILEGGEPALSPGRP